MSNEARINSSLQIRIVSGTVTELDYQSRPNSFNGDVSVANGPTPGGITASLLGTVVDLSQLASPGYCWIANMDPTNYVEVGVYDPDANEFYPMLEILPGQSYPLLLSRFLGQEFGTSLPGTSAVGTGIQLMIKAVGGACNVRVDAFDR